MTEFEDREVTFRLRMEDGNILVVSFTIEGSDEPVAGGIIDALVGALTGAKAKPVAGKPIKNVRRRVAPPEENADAWLKRTSEASTKTKMKGWGQK